jgi:hypothetical protein
MVQIAVSLIFAFLGLFVFDASVSHAQTLRTLTASDQAQRVESTTICRNEILPPRVLPPATGGAIVYLFALCFDGPSKVEPETYLKDVQLRPSQPTQGAWVYYDPAAERLIFEDFQRLRANHALDNISIDVRDYRFSNGVIGKLVTYNLKERN